MDRTPPPLSLAAALALKLPSDRRSAEVFVDGDLSIRFTASPTKGPQVPHEQDEFYIVASGNGRYRVADSASEVGPGDLLFAAAGAPHGFEDYSDDFAIWIVFYGPRNA